MKVTPILWKYDPRADGTFALKVRHSYTKYNKKVRDYYLTGVYLKEHQWNEKTNRVEKHENAVSINLLLVKLKNTVDSEILKDPEINVGFLIQSVLNSRLEDEVKIDQNVKEDKKYTLVEFFEKYIELCKAGKILRKKVNTKMTAGYLKTLNTTKVHIEEFQELGGQVYHFEDITFDWNSEYITYLREDYAVKKKKDGKVVFGASENTIAKDIKNVKTVMSYAAKKMKLHTNLDYEEFEANWVKVKKVRLNEDEVKAILKVDTINKHPELKDEQDRFSLAYNFLLRFTDSISIDEKHIFFENKKPFLDFLTQKTKERVIIPISDRNYKLLKERNFKLNAVANSTSNDKLKFLAMYAGITDLVTVSEWRKGEKIEKRVPKYTLMSAHITRRSAATNMRLSGVSLAVIKVLGGWTSERQVEDYIDIDTMEVANMATSIPSLNL